MKNKRKPADTLTLFQKNTPIQPDTGLSTVASAPRANVHDFWSLVNEPLKEGGRRGSSYLAVVRNGGVAVLQVCEHDEPVMRPLRGNMCVSAQLRRE